MGPWMQSWQASEQSHSWLQSLSWLGVMVWMKLEPVGAQRATPGEPSEAVLAAVPGLAAVSKGVVD